MIKISVLQDFLSLDEGDVKNLKTEQLRLLVGVLRYSTRVVQREINEREEAQESTIKGR